MVRLLYLCVEKSSARDLSEDEANEAVLSESKDFAGTQEYVKLQAKFSKKTVLRQQMKTVVDTYDNSSVRVSFLVPFRN